MLTRPAPYTLTRIEKVQPGNHVHMEGHGVVVVDEVRQTTEGYTLLGWPPERAGQGRRVSRTTPVGDEVVLYADGSIGSYVASGLAALVDSANAHDQAQYDAQPTDPEGFPAEAFVPRYRFDLDRGPSIVVTVRGTIWYVPVATPLVDPAPSTSTAPAPDPEGDAMTDDALDHTEGD